jgi:hypothetical protein
MPECCDAKLLQVLFRQARKNRLVYLILAKCGLILPEAQAPQLDHNVHDGARPFRVAVHHDPRPKGFGPSQQALTARGTRTWSATQVMRVLARL